MRETFSAIWQAVSSLIGLAVFLIIMWLAARLHSRMWRLVSARYRNRKREPILARKLETIVVAARGAGAPVTSSEFRWYPGTIISVAEKGLTLTLVPPFNVMCPSLSLPFDEMKLERTYWALWSEPFAVRMRKLPDIDIIIGRDAVQWISSRTDQAPFGFNA